MSKYFREIEAERQAEFDALTPKAQELLENIYELGGIEIHSDEKEANPLLKELLATKLVTIGGGRGPHGQWHRVHAYNDEDMI